MEIKLEPLIDSKQINLFEGYNKYLSINLKCFSLPREYLFPNPSEYNISSAKASLEVLRNTFGWN